MEEIILYSTGCPKCKVLKKKLESKNIEYKEINDIEEMKKFDILSVPVLRVDARLYNFNDAVKYINNL